MNNSDQANIRESILYPSRRLLGCVHVSSRLNHDQIMDKYSCAHATYNFLQSLSKELNCINNANKAPALTRLLDYSITNPAHAN